ncbi:MAG: phosphomannomutase/phosphoglucomutase [SAR86 cluster bacterium]|jgi:phosphomannomutase/phosphoglucomutase|nr:phosphomannomutase/phosphoglucomutase [SAR86 cluster bacterium]
MDLNANIFRAYDIRGIAYKDLTQEIVTLIGQGLGSDCLEKGNSSLVIARDGRNSSPDIFEWISLGIKSTGCNIINIGVVPTPLLYFATHKLASSSGVMITGSHNPGDYNGFKIVRDKRSISGEAIQDLRLKIIKKDFQKGVGSEEKVNVKDTYIGELTKHINLRRPIKVAIDCGNGVASVIAQEVYENLGCEVLPLFCELDGNFPNHHPDPSRPENLKDLKEAVIDKKFEIGLAFDGDADRLGIVSKKGDIIFPDMQMIIFSRSILKKNRDAKIVFDVKCSKLLAEAITESEGIPIMSKTGHSHIKDRIFKENALLGGEMSGHIFFNDKWPGFDDGIYAGARMLEILSKFSQDEDIFSDLPKLVSTPEINIKTTDEEKFHIVEEFIATSNFKNSKSIKIDGVRVEFENGWGLLRASNTSPNLVLRFEANSKEDLESIKDSFRQTLQRIRPNLGRF